MNSSTSSSSTEPTVTVVIGSNAPVACVTGCLEALEPQLDDAVEVLVYDGAGSATTIAERFPWVTIHPAPDTLVPFQWRDGIDIATGEIVALTISQMRPAPDWISTLRALHTEHDVVGGAIDPGRGLRLRDWAEYFCRYARDMRPFAAGPNVDLAGDNATYDRAVLESVRDSYREGFWEPVAHHRLVDRDITLWHAPELVVEQGRSAGAVAFARQRFAHGRLYGHQRGRHFGRARNLVGVLAAPLVPALMTYRVVSRVFAKRRYRGRVVLALPGIVWFNVVWAFAEARGHFDMLRST
jgi:hypothetical protein